MATARQFLRLTKEVTYGTYQATPPAADVVVFHLPGDNPFTPRLTPIYEEQRSAGGSNRRTHKYTKQRMIEGNLTTKGFSSQTKLLMGKAITLAGSPYNLGSFTVDQAIALDDNSAFVVKRYLGGMISSAAIKGSAASGSWALDINFGMIFKTQSTIDLTIFPEPDFTTAPHYPTENPWTFQDSSGHFTLGSGLRTAYSELNIDVKNMLVHPHDEGIDISYCRWSGRDVSASFKSRYLSTADRDALEAATSQAMTIEFFDGTNTMTFTFPGRNYTVKVDDSLPLAGDGFQQTVSIDSILGSAGGNELAFAQTP